MNITAEEASSFDVLKEVRELKKKDIYLNSVFYPIKILSSRKKGAYFEKVVSEALREKGYVVEKAKTSGHDRIVVILDDVKKVEIKGSFLWEGGTHFRWQQIRPDQDYDTICFLAVFPDRLEIYGATHEQCSKHIDVQDSNGHWPYNQHGGKKVRSGAFSIDVKPNEIPSWFKPVEELL